MKIRSATSDDLESIREIYLSAFPENEASQVGKLAVDLLDKSLAPGAISFVSESEGEVSGHISFSPVKPKGGDELIGFILAPLAVAPGRQKAGIGSALVKAGLDWISIQEYPLVLVYGDPDYYGRFGFEAELAEHYPAPYPLEYPFGWQAMELFGPEPMPEPTLIECVPALQYPEIW